MADTFVERITGQTHATDLNGELQIVMELDALLDTTSHKPAELLGYGGRDRPTWPATSSPIRPIDHIQRYTDGGLTIYPNGRGECERGNYAREMPGWKAEISSSYRAASWLTHS